MDNRSKRALVREMLAELKANPLKRFSDAEMAMVVPAEQRGISIACATHADDVRELELAAMLGGKKWEELYPSVAEYQRKAQRARESHRQGLDFIERHHGKAARLRAEADEWESQVNSWRANNERSHADLLGAWKALTDQEKAWFVPGIPPADTNDVRELPGHPFPELGLFPGERMPDQEFQIRDLEAVLEQLREEGE